MSSELRVGGPAFHLDFKRRTQMLSTRLPGRSTSQYTTRARVSGGLSTPGVIRQPPKHNKVRSRHPPAGPMRPRDGRPLAGLSRIVTVSRGPEYSRVVPVHGD